MDHTPIKLFPHLEKASVYSEEIGSQIIALDHDHDFYEIAMVRSGTAEHRSNGVTTEVSEGDVFIIPRGTSHSWESTRDLDLLNIYYCPERFLSIIGASKASTLLHCLFFSADLFKNPAMSAVTNFKCAEFALFSIRRELEEIQYLTDCDQDIADTFYSGCFLKILSGLARDYTRHHSLSNKHMHPAVYRLLDILNQYAIAGEVPNISAHADQLGVSLQHLTRIFSEGVGMPPFKYFNKRRLEHAKDLLIKDAHTHTEIAHRLGFCDSAHFTRVFKENFLVTPSEFKSRHVPSKKVA